MAWQDIPNKQHWQYDNNPPNPGGLQTALWATSTNGVRINTRGVEIYVNCRNGFLHPTQDSFPNEINKTFWAPGVTATPPTNLDYRYFQPDGVSLYYNPDTTSVYIQPTILDTPNLDDHYFRPDSVSRYYRPDSTSVYIKPTNLDTHYFQPDGVSLYYNPDTTSVYIQP